MMHAEWLSSQGGWPSHAQPAGLNAAPQLTLDVMDFLPVGICLVDAELQTRAFNLTARCQPDFPDRLFAEVMPNFAGKVLLNAQRGEHGAGEPCDLARIGEKHAGSIKVSSSPGEETTFCIEVPLRQNAAVARWTRGPQ